jgi:hypothetical protein
VDIVTQPVSSSTKSNMTDADSDFYRPAGPREASCYSTAELERRETLSAAIAKNLRVITTDTNDLAALEHRLESIVAAIRLMRELAEAMDLPQLELRIASIASALRLIADNDVVKELEAKQ